jgi:D-galactarolactone cycloisomerase
MRIPLGIRGGGDHALAPRPPTVVRSNEAAEVSPHARIVIVLERLEGAQDVAVGQHQQPLRRGLLDRAAGQVVQLLPAPAAVAGHRDRVTDGDEPFGDGVVDGAIDTLVEGNHDRQQLAGRQLSEGRPAKIPTGSAQRIERLSKVAPGFAVVAAQNVRPAIVARSSRPDAMGEHDHAARTSHDPRLTRVAARVIGGSLPHDRVAVDRNSHPTTLPLMDRPSSVVASVQEDPAGPGPRIVDVRVIDAHPNWTLGEVEAEDGSVGIGLTQSSSAVIAPIIESGAGALRHHLIGADPRDVGRLWRRMYEGWPGQWGRGSEGGLAVNAMALLDLALWDLAGKLRGEPVWGLLGGLVQDRIMAYASGSVFVSSSYEGAGPWRRKTPRALADEAAGYVNAGFRAMKFGWGTDFEAEDRERLHAVRDAIGPDVRLMVDIGCCPGYWTPGWDTSAAIRAGRILEEVDGYFMEEPMPPHDVEGHARVRAGTRTRIASGESLTQVHEFERFIDREALSIVQPDACQMGITQTVAVARRAEAAGLLCAPHSPWSAIAVAAHLAVQVTGRNGVLVEYPALATYDDGSRAGALARITNFELIEHPVDLVDGYLVPSHRPGLGLGGFVPAVVERLRALA